MNEGLLFLCAAVLHELGHILCARLLGIPLTGCSVRPCGALLTFDFSRTSYLREGCVHLAGAGTGLITAAAAVALWLCGCADPVVFSEVFQQKSGEDIYTRYNLWYEDPQEVSCLNIQSGSFIPIGSAIEPLSTGSFP